MTKRRRITLYVVVPVAVLAVLAVTAYFILAPKAASASGTTTRTATVSTGTVEATVSASGNLEAGSTADESFEVSGTIASISVSVGDTVKKGATLATLDTTDLEAAVTSAQASVTSAKQTAVSARLSYTSAKQSLTAAKKALTAAKKGTSSSSSSSSSANGSGTSSTTSTATSVASAKAAVTSAQAQVQSAAAQVTQADAAITSAQASLTSAKDDLSKATLTASISGTVTAVNASKGDQASASSTGSSSSSSSSGSSATSSTSTTSSSSAVVEISNTKTYVLSASFDEADATTVKVGDKASLTFPALDDSVTATGTITSLDPIPTTSNSVVTYTGTITLSDVPSEVRIGQSAEASIVTQSAENVLSVPTQALTVSGSSYSVVVVGDDDTRTETTVEIGVQGDSTTEITSGLTEGQKVLISEDTSVGDTSSTAATTNEQGGFGGTGGGTQGGGFPGGGGPGGN